MRSLAVILALTLGLALQPSGSASAVEPDEILKDPVLEARAREIGKELRCLVCQNQSIDDSNAELARDLRVLVRERVASGDSDRQVMDYVVSRYGDFVLLRPPFKNTTLVLWGGPILLLGIGVVAVAVYYRRRGGKAVAPVPLSADEKRRLAALLDDGDA